MTTPGRERERRGSYQLARPLPALHARLTAFSSVGSRCRRGGRRRCTRVLRRLCKIWNIVQLAESEIRQADVPVGIKQDVVWLDVTAHGREAQGDGWGAQEAPSQTDRHTLREHTPKRHEDLQHRTHEQGKGERQEIHVQRKGERYDHTQTVIKYIHSINSADMT